MSPDLFPVVRVDLLLLVKKGGGSRETGSTGFWEMTGHEYRTVIIS